MLLHCGCNGQIDITKKEKKAFKSLKISSGLLVLPWLGQGLRAWP